MVVQLELASKPLTALVIRVFSVEVVAKKLLTFVVKVTSLELKLVLLVSRELSWSFKFL